MSYNAFSINRFLYVLVMLLGILRAPNNKNIFLGSTISAMGGTVQDKAGDLPPSYEEATGAVSLPVINPNTLIVTRGEPLPSTSIQMTIRSKPHTRDYIESNYCELQKKFVDKVTRIQYDPNFLKPCKSIADSKEIKEFLGYVGKAYEDLAVLYIFAQKNLSQKEKNNTKMNGETLTFSRLVLDSSETQESQLKQKILNFMVNATNMAHKFMFELGIIKFDTIKQMNTISNLVNLDLNRDKSNLPTGLRIHYYIKESEAIAMTLKSSHNIPSQPQNVTK